MRQLVTLLVPTLERFDLLMLLLKGLESESPAVVRVVISDNGSADPRYICDLPEICRRHPLEVKLIRKERTIPAVENFNSLLDHIDTDYAAFYADDDRWSLGAITAITQAMKRDGIDFGYAEHWAVHDRNSGEAFADRRMHVLHEGQAIKNTIEFVKYDNDPHIYGIFRSSILKRICRQFCSGWKLLPSSYAADTAFPAMFLAYLACSKIAWYPYRHSQGAPRSDRSKGGYRDFMRRLAALFKESLFYLVRKPQIWQRYLAILSEENTSIGDRAKILGYCIAMYPINIPLIFVVRKNVAKWLQGGAL